MSPIATGILALIFATTAFVQTPPAPREVGDRAGLMRLESIWNDAHLGGDAAALDRLWADDIIVTVQGMPVMRKPQALGMLRAGRMKFEKYESSEVLVQLYGDSAVVTGRVTRSRVVSSTPAVDNWRFTKVYVRRPDGWRVVAWHASDAAK